MKIMITGYKGFIGQNMVNALEKDHQLTVFEWGDKFPDLKGHDWCIHLGAITSTTETDVDKVLEQNYDFSRFLINQCQESGVNLQFASSASVYGLGSDFRETAPVSPANPYAWSKYLFERYVWGLSDRWTIRVQGFRYFNVYGSHEDHKGDQASPYFKFEKQAQETGVIKLFEGSDGFLRDFVPVEQVVDIHKKFFNVQESGIWNLGTGQSKSFKEVAENIATKHNAKIEYILMPENIEKHYQKFTEANLQKLKASLNASNG
jgi:ADP-L-glycero-D-manno-heptose 6-epimerase